jgi:hypothetical protein
LQRENFKTSRWWWYERQDAFQKDGILSLEPSTQVGMSDVEKEKAEKKKGKEVGEDGVPKHQKYYQYDYFKEWWGPPQSFGTSIPPTLTPPHHAASLPYLPFHRCKPWKLSNISTLKPWN